jgi:hypothetical protein
VSTLKVNNLTDLGADAVVTDGVIDSGALPTGSILQMQSITKTDTFSASVTIGSNVAVTGMSISMAVSDVANKLVIFANFGVSSSSSNDGRIGIAVADDGTLLNLGDAAGNRTRVSTGGITHTSTSSATVAYPSTHFVYTPGDTDSHDYVVHAINTETSTRTLYVNRSPNDLDNQAFTRGASTLTIMEVAG